MNLYGKYQITETEHERRKKQMESVDGSCGLSGVDFTNSSDNLFYQMWVDGDLTFEELISFLEREPS